MAITVRAGCMAGSRRSADDTLTFGRTLHLSPRCDFLALCFCGNFVDTSSGATDTLFDRAFRAVHPKRQDQSGSLSRHSSVGFSSLDSEIHSLRLAGASLASIPPRHQMRPTISRGILRRSIPVVYCALHLRRDIGCVTRADTGRSRRPLHHDRCCLL